MGCVFALWCVFVIFVVARSAVIPICNVKTTGIKIIVVVITLSRVVRFLWTVHSLILCFCVWYLSCYG